MSVLEFIAVSADQSYRTSIPSCFSITEKLKNLLVSFILDSIGKCGKSDISCGAFSVCTFLFEDNFPLVHCWSVVSTGLISCNLLLTGYRCWLTSKFVEVVIVNVRFWLYVSELMLLHTVAPPMHLVTVFVHCYFALRKFLSFCRLRPVLTFFTSQVFPITPIVVLKRWPTFWEVLLNTRTSAVTGESSAKGTCNGWQQVLL